MLVVSPDGDEGLSNVNAGNGAKGLAESTSHSGLEPIGSGAGQHFVDSEDMEGVDANADVELVLGRVLHHVLENEYSFMKHCSKVIVESQMGIFSGKN